MGAPKNWPWPRGVYGEFVRFGVQPVLFSPASNLPMMHQISQTGSVCGLHRGSTLHLPTDAHYHTQVLHELAHAAVWCLNGRGGDLQWGLLDPRDVVAETDVAAVHLELLRRRRSSFLQSVSGLHEYFTRGVGIPLGSLEEACRDGRTIWRDAVTATSSTG